MRQITKAEAIRIYRSKVWEKWSNDKIVKHQLLQKRLMMDFSKFHEAIEKVLNRPVYTHEFGLNYEGLIQEWLGTKKAPTLEEIINLIPEEKRIIISR